MDITKNMFTFLLFLTSLLYHEPELLIHLQSRSEKILSPGKVPAALSLSRVFIKLLCASSFSKSNPRLFGFYPPPLNVSRNSLSLPFSFNIFRSRHDRLLMTLATRIITSKFAGGFLFSTLIALVSPYQAPPLCLSFLPRSWTDLFGSSISKNDPSARYRYPPTLISSNC